MSETKPRYRVVSDAYDLRTIILDKARELVQQRIPYKYGGTDLTGLDCSSFVQWCYAAAGLHIGRTTWDQIGECTLIPEAQLVPGDLIFCSFAQQTDHVMMWAGNGMVLQEPDEGYVACEVPFAGTWRAHATAFGLHNALRNVPVPTPSPSIIIGNPAQVDADEGLNLRNAPSITGNVLMLMADKQWVMVGGNSITANGILWRQVSTVDNTGNIRTGWCSEEFLA